MSGVAVTVELEATAARTALARLAELASDPGPVLDEIGAFVQDRTRLRFEEQRGPDGESWPPSGRALQQGGQTLVDTGRLRDSITRVLEGAAVAVGTNVVYGAIHQFGGTIRAKGGGKLRFRTGDRWAAVEQVTLPARPYLGVDDEDAREIAAIVEAALARAAGGGDGA